MINNIYSICRYEDGTVSFLSILALKHCFDTLYSLIPKIVNDDVMETISHHTFYLAQDFYNQLKMLTHENGNKSGHLYMDSDFTDISKQGSIVAFNLKRKNGSFVGYAEVCNTLLIYTSRLFYKSNVKQLLL